VLVANILIRAVLGARVRTLIEMNADRVRLCAPDAAYSDAYSHLPVILAKRQLPLTALEVP